eukprot:scaffold1562_cov170-Amphora_coffeaeformis.AAC.6
MAKVVSTSKNPLTEDPALKKLLDEITDIPDELQFQRWKDEFLTQFDAYLDPAGSHNADYAFKDFSAGVLSLAKDVRRMETFMEAGDMTEEKCSVQARRCLGNFTTKCTKIATMMNELMPPTQEAEREAGFTKFNLGAILVRDGFVEYDRLEKIKIHLAGLRKNGLEKVADQMTLGIINKYGAAFDQLLDILADLGLYQVMEQCTSFIKGEWAPTSPARRKSSDLSSLQDALRQAPAPDLAKCFDSNDNSDSTAPESSDSVEEVKKVAQSPPARRDRSPSPVARKPALIRNESPQMKRESPRRVPMRSKSVGRGTTDMKDFTRGMSRSTSDTFEFIIHGADEWKGIKSFTGNDVKKPQQAPVKEPTQRSKSVGPAQRRNMSMSPVSRKSDGPALRRNMSMSPVRRKAPLRTASLDGAFDPRASTSSRGGRRPSSDEPFDPRASTSSRGGRKPSSLEQDPIPKDSTSSRSSRASIKPNKLSKSQPPSPTKEQDLDRSTMNLGKQPKDNKKQELNRPTMNLVKQPKDNKEQELNQPTMNLVKQPKDSKPDLTKPTIQAKRPTEPRERARSVGRPKATDDSQRSKRSSPDDSQRSKRSSPDDSQRSKRSSPDDSQRSKRSSTPFRNKEKASPMDEGTKRSETNPSRGRDGPADSRPRGRSCTPGPHRRDAPINPVQKSAELKPVDRREKTPSRQSFSKRPATPARHNSAKQPIVPPQQSGGQRPVTPARQTSSQQPVTKSLDDKKTRKIPEPNRPADPKSSPESPDKLKTPDETRKQRQVSEAPKQKPPMGKPDKDGFCPCCGQKWPLWKRIFGFSK